MQPDGTLLKHYTAEHPDKAREVARLLGDALPAGVKPFVDAFLEGALAFSRGDRDLCPPSCLLAFVGSLEAGPAGPRLMARHDVYGEKPYDLGDLLRKALPEGLSDPTVQKWQVRVKKGTVEITLVPRYQPTE
jgi:hypothetical protein